MAVPISRLRVKAVFTLTIVAFFVLVSALPVESQIHWNRGWGAGGSVGKRSYFGSNSADMKNQAPRNVISPECSVELFNSATLLSQQLQKEIENILLCESEMRLTGGTEDTVYNKKDSLSSLYPLLTTSKKMGDIK